MVVGILITLTQKVNDCRVVASNEDTSCDQNGKPSTLQFPLTNWDSFVLLQIRMANAVTNWDTFIIKNWCNKLGQLLHIRATIITKYPSLGQPLQIGANLIANWGRYYKLRQLLRIGA